MYLLPISLYKIIEYAPPFLSRSKVREITWGTKYSENNIESDVKDRLKTYGKS